MADLNVGQLGLLLAVTLASAVEFVEAFTIVLAMGITRDWRSTLAGTALALVALAAVTLFAGYALIEWFPEALLQLVIGTLLLIFGLAMAAQGDPSRSGAQGAARRGRDLP